MKNKSFRYLLCPTASMAVRVGLLMVGVWGIRLLPVHAQPLPNIIFILSDDHRYDAMGFMKRIPGLSTPGLDRMAREGAHLKNAFVSTSLCSPSRASILTGQYAHTHTVVDNDAPMPANLMFFSQYLKKKNYQTAFLGKWHMGNVGEMPQPGFDYYVGFKGQGVYYNPLLHINGRPVQTTDSTYITDTLTGLALQWLNRRDVQKPFMLYLSHKGVHAEFEPAQRHRHLLKDIPIICPPSMYLTATETSRVWGQPTAPTTPVNYQDIPQWVRRQRYSWHGVDYIYHGFQHFEGFYRRYLETLLSVDESVQRILEWVVAAGIAKNTVVLYMGDNGFGFGEHGLIDKRHAYEESMRVPMLAWAPGSIQPGTVVEEMVMGADIAPTVLDMAHIAKPGSMQAASFWPLLQGKKIPWRDQFFYAYYWEAPFPQTPTQFAVRTSRYKLIYYFGIWDINELYDLQEDPYEMNNLIRSLPHQAIARQLRGELFDWLEQTGGLQIPLKRPDGKRIDHLYRDLY